MSASCSAQARRRGDGRGEHRLLSCRPRAASVGLRPRIYLLLGRRFSRGPSASTRRSSCRLLLRIFGGVSDRAIYRQSLDVACGVLVMLAFGVLMLILS